MTLSFEFLMTRAEEAATEAKVAVLDNVKARALRSEAAWREMADRALKITSEREKARVDRARLDHERRQVADPSEQTTPAQP